MQRLDVPVVVLPVNEVLCFTTVIILRKEEYVADAVRLLANVIARRPSSAYRTDMGSLVVCLLDEGPMGSRTLAGAALLSASEQS